MVIACTADIIAKSLSLLGSEASLANDVFALCQSVPDFEEVISGRDEEGRIHNLHGEVRLSGK